jgi:hypothetical protein
MTQSKANEIFKTQIGEQLDIIYTTSDDRAFVRHGEAITHIQTEELEDEKVETWFPE